MKWGIERSKSDHVHIYLESTVEAAPFYKNLGFTAATTVSMPLPAIDSNPSEDYEEIIFIIKS
jgi:hypothetical protein